MITKTRSNFLNNISVDGIQEKDINDMKWGKLTITRPITYYKINEGDIQRPDLVCNRIYGNMQYFWVLMKFNQIDDIWNDLTAGDIIKCPNALDIEHYFSVVKTNGR